MKQELTNWLYAMWAQRSGFRDPKLNDPLYPVKEQHFIDIGSAALKSKLTKIKHEFVHDDGLSLDFADDGDWCGDIKILYGKWSEIDNDGLFVNDYQIQIIDDAINIIGYKNGVIIYGRNNTDEALITPSTTITKHGKPGKMHGHWGKYLAIDKWTKLSGFD